MKHYYLLIIFSAAFLHSEEDSSKVFRMQDVIVTGTRTAVPVEQLSTSVQVLDSLALARVNGISLADMLRNSSGLSLRGYGGYGALQSVSFRGLGSDYSLILIDGQRFTLHQISTVDIGIFQTNEIERIEVASGGNSSQYGSDAIGGVINIVTQRPDGKAFVSLAHSFGSFGLSGYQLSAGAGDESFSYRGSLSMRRAVNNYHFHFDDGVKDQTLQRMGADYALKNYSLSARSVFTDAAASQFLVRYSSADRGQPAAVTNSQQNNLARINDRDLFLNSTTEIRFPEGMILSLPLTYHFNRQRFIDPNLIVRSAVVDAHYENNLFAVSPVIRYSISSEHHVVTGGDVSIASITSNEVFASRREQVSAFISTEHRFSELAEIIIFPSVRFDSFSDTDGDISPKIGMNIGILDFPSIRIRASYGKNYRVPTFNDLYWIDGGNPRLTPERSLNFDAGIIAGLKANDLDASFELTYFSIDASNKIVWQPSSGTMWTPVNLQSVSSKGFEGRVNVNLWQNLFMLNYSHNILRTMKTSEDTPGDISQGKILPYVPQEFSSISLGSAWNDLSVNLTYSFTGFRFETSDNNPRFFLPSVENIDANISYAIVTDDLSLRLRGEINNLGNSDVQLIRGYPLPLRNYCFTTTISL